MSDDVRPKGPTVLAVPDGDNRERLICPDCGFIQYENPKIVVGAVVWWQDRVLLCKRAINPRQGYWTLPAGYLELNETTDQGAIREAFEEARARIALDGVLAVYNIPRLSQVQIIYRARLVSPEIGPGPESTAVELFPWIGIPWSDLAFPSVHWALEHAREVGDAQHFVARTNPEGQHGNVR
ncbi:MAG TPA: NUDIX hydrolase [Alphaproteobacteria bacterium]|nr:NUDIX hydrolase [Alphaproteobacteria bacterium]